MIAPINLENNGLRSQSIAGEIPVPREDVIEKLGLWLISRANWQSAGRSKRRLGRDKL